MCQVGSVNDSFLLSLRSVGLLQYFVPVQDKRNNLFRLCNFKGIMSSLKSSNLVPLKYVLNVFHPGSILLYIVSFIAIWIPGHREKKLLLVVKQNFLVQQYKTPSHQKDGMPSRGT